MSPVDWALMEEWEEKGVPLNIVLSTIDELFDQVQADPKRSGSIRTLAYCKDAVEARYSTWKESMIGAPETEPEESSEETGTGAGMAGRLALLESSLVESLPGLDGSVRDAVSSASENISGLSKDGSDADIEEVLDGLDESIDEALFRSLGDEERKTLRHKALEELGRRRTLMTDAALEQTIERMIRRELRKESGIPILGMFRL